ncbi:zinc finger MYM-type protein 1-like%2C partial [Scomber scombrus]|uniref:Zinc finger MYM-type protein 1-like, partial n=1 Tax=Scomber scombrus TaxID=13677 RepID=A0AAV1QJ17_SCOSC
MDRFLLPKRPRSESIEDANVTVSAAGDISNHPQEGPRRPVLQKYPTRQFGNLGRHFLKRVRRFNLEPAFTSDGFNNWRKQKETSGSKIANMLDKGHSASVMEKRKYMKAVVESLSFTACQGIAQRGHREDEESHNLGNFCELLHVIAKFDPTVDKKLATNPSNAKYAHHDIQNEIFAVMAEMIRKKISDEVRDAVCFAVLVDESISKKEQISVIVRYLQPESGEVHEEFLHFTAADGLDADSLLASINPNYTFPSGSVCLPVSFVPSKKIATGKLQVCEFMAK